MSSPDPKKSIADRLIFAVATGDAEAVRQLIEEEANFVACRDMLHELIGTAFRCGSLEVLDLLIEIYINFLDINCFSDNGLTLLHLAARYGRRDLAERLMMHGADRHARNRAGLTPEEVAKVGVRIDWDHLSESARRALASKDAGEIASILLPEGQKPYALLELLGSRRFPAVLAKLVAAAREPGMTEYIICSFDKIIGSMSHYWRREYRHALAHAEAILARSRALPDSALARYAAGRSSVAADAGPTPAANNHADRPHETLRAD